MNKEEHYIYKITNINPTDTRQFYIGVRTAKNKSAEEDITYFGSSKSLNEAISTEGIENFVKEILSIWNTRKEAALEEIRLHEEYDVAVNESFYNLAKATSIGFDVTGTKNSLETIEKKRISSTGRMHTQETKDKLAKIRFGSKHSKESLEKMSVKHSGENNAFFGKNHSEASILKMRNSTLGTKHTTEQNKNHSEAMTGNKNPFFGKNHSLETKKKISMALKGKIPASAKKFILTNPEGNQFYVEAGIKLFCKYHDISYGMINQMLNHNTIPTTRSKCFGWTVSEVKRIKI